VTSDSEIEERISVAQGAWERRRVDQAMAIGPWEEIARLREQIERLRGCLREVQQVVFDLRAKLAVVGVEKPVRKLCKSGEGRNEKRKKAHKG
jgi:hypothetical protein